MATLTKDQIERIKKLYSEMPGAEMPPFEDGERVWGHVDQSEHWRFCETIVRMMDESAARTVGAHCMDFI